MRGWCGRQFLLVGWMALIFWMSSDSQSGERSLELVSSGFWGGWWSAWGLDLQWIDYLVRKAAHVGEYAVLFALWRWNGFSARSAWAASLAYALSDEFHQLWVPERSGSLSDVGIDAGGMALAHLLWSPCLEPLLQRVEKWGSRDRNRGASQESGQTL